MIKIRYLRLANIIKELEEALACYECRVENNAWMMQEKKKMSSCCNLKLIVLVVVVFFPNI